jgi:Domain of unknown function (DUF4397)
MRRVASLVMSGVIAGSLLIAGAGSASAAPKATLNVLHGIPGAKVDVCVNGAEAKSNFVYKQRFSAKLAAGTYKIKVRAATAGTCKGAVILKANPTLKGGKNYTVVAGLTAKASPKLFLFRNDLRNTMTGNARLTVRHVAAAPAVDVWVNGSPFLHGVRNGASWTGQVPKADYTVRVAPTGTATTVIGPRTFGLGAGTAYQVFATGNAKAGYIFQVIAQPTR